MTSPARTTVLEPAEDPPRTWRSGLTTALAVAAPLLFTLSNVVMPALGRSNASVVAHIPAVAGRLLATNLIYALAPRLLVCLAVSRWRATPRAGTVLRFAGGVLLIVGGVSNALGEVVYGYDGWGLHAAAVAPAGQVRLFDLLDHSPAALPVSFLAIPVLSLGLLLAMAGLLPARGVPWVLPALVIR